MRIGIFCKSDLLFQKIRLALYGTAECVRIADGGGEEFFLTIAEDTGETVPAGAILMSKKDGADLKIPFTIEALRATVKKRSESDEYLKLDEKRKSVLFKGRLIKLTELEFSLLSLLMSKRRAFSKEEILKGVWSANTDSGIVNVYIHYLREKLEADGEKVITALRGRGYKIDERFLSGGAENASFN